MAIELPTASDPVKVINADCLDVLRELPDGCVDAVVTDPPYGVGFKYASHDDTEIGYGAWLWSIISEAERACLPGSPLFVWQATKNIRHFSEWFPRKWRICVAAKNFAQVLPGSMWPAFEPVVTWWTPGEPFVWEGCRRDFVLADTTPSGRKAKGDVVIGHPCPRPLAHVLHFVNGWCRPGGIVLDPFGGSGTTAVAAIRSKRRCIIIEKDAGYCSIIRRRVAAAIDPGLFAPLKSSKTLSLFD